MKIRFTFRMETNQNAARLAREKIASRLSVKGEALVRRGRRWAFDVKGLPGGMIVPKWIVASFSDVAAVEGVEK